MIVPCSEIKEFIQQDLKQKVKILAEEGIYPRLVTLHVGESEEQESYVRIKEKLADELGVTFEYIHIPKPPPLFKFMQTLKEHCNSPNVTGIVIQQPLPSRLQSDTIYNFIPLPKEIEGHRAKSPHIPPLGQAILTALKYIYVKQEISENLYPNLAEDPAQFKALFKTKKIVLMGNGLTGGKPIGDTLTNFKINYININSKTPNPNEYIEQADIIITAVGKDVLDPSLLKKDVVLLNIGLHKDGKSLAGDYDEKAIADIASWYTQTPGGLGPIDVLYLYKNLIEAARMKVERRR
jgi:methylenetetrahydrofolate dehydrogenase (NADP+)/methenyltetrahydrofolate cyclohydrolase